MSTKFEKFYFDKHIFDEEEEEDIIPVEDLIADAEAKAQEAGHNLGYKEGHASGYDEGKKDGYDQSIQSIDNKTNQTITAITPLLQTLLQAETEREERFEREALTLSLTIVKKLFPVAIQKIGPEEVEASIKEILIDQTGQNNIIIDVSPDVEERMNAHIQSLGASLGGTDKIVINPNMDLPSGQCQLSWNHGGAAKDIDSVAISIVETLQDLLGITDPVNFDTAALPQEQEGEAIEEPAQENPEIDDDSEPEICETGNTDNADLTSALDDPAPVEEPQDMSPETMEKSEEENPEEENPNDE